MTRLMIALLCAGLAVPAMAADPGTPAAAEGAKAETKTAAAPKPSADKMVGDVMAVSGIKRDLERLPKTLQDGFRSSLEERTQNKKGALPPAVQQAMEASVKESFTAQGFVGAVTRALKKDYSEPRYSELLNDLSTPLATRIEELEKKDPPAEEVWSSFFVELKSDPASGPRMELIKRLDAARRSSDILGEVLVSVEKDMMRGVAIASGCVTERQLDGVEGSIKDKLEGLRDNGRYMSQALLAYTYREVNDADLTEYVNIFEKAGARHIYDVAYAAIGDELSQGNTRMVRSFMKAIRDQRLAQGDHSCEEAQPQAASGVPAAPTGASGVAPVPKPGSGVAAPAQKPAGAQKTAPRIIQGGAPGSKSAIPPEKRQGADARKCLELGSDKEIAACAEKFR
jgi:hypothetical protein